MNTQTETRCTRYSGKELALLARRAAQSFGHKVADISKFNVVVFANGHVQLEVVMQNGSTIGEAL